MKPLLSEFKSQHGCMVNEFLFYFFSHPNLLSSLSNEKMSPSLRGNLVKAHCIWLHFQVKRHALTRIPSVERNRHFRPSQQGKVCWLIPTSIFPHKYWFLKIFWLWSNRDLMMCKHLLCRCVWGHREATSGPRNTTSQMPIKTGKATNRDPGYYSLKRPEDCGKINGCRVRDHHLTRMTNIFMTSEGRIWHDRKSGSWMRARNVSWNQRL